MDDHLGLDGYDFATSIPSPDWLERFTPLLPILRESSIPVLVWGGDALCIEEALAGSNKILQIVVPEASQLPVAAALLTKDYDILHDPARSERKPCIVIWKEVFMVHQGCNFAFPAETTTVLKERADSSAPPYTRPQYIFIHASSVVHIDMSSDESRTCTLTALPPDDFRRKLKFPTLPALYDSLIDTRFEPPRSFRHHSLDRELTDILYDIHTRHYEDSESDEAESKENGTSDDNGVQKNPLVDSKNGTLLPHYASILRSVKEENRPYLNRLFRTIGLWSPSWDDVAQERMQLKIARL